MAVSLCFAAICALAAGQAFSLWPQPTQMETDSAVLSLDPKVRGAIQKCERIFLRGLHKTR
jgi:hypothetical protein